MFNPLIYVGEKIVYYLLPDELKGVGIWDFIPVILMTIIVCNICTSARIQNRLIIGIILSAVMLWFIVLLRYLKCRKRSEKEGKKLDLKRALISAIPVTVLSFGFFATIFVLSFLKNPIIGVTVNLLGGNLGYLLLGIVSSFLYVISMLQEVCKV